MFPGKLPLKLDKSIGLSISTDQRNDTSSIQPISFEDCLSLINCRVLRFKNNSKVFSKRIRTCFVSGKMASFLYSKQLTTKNRMVEVNKGGATRVTVVFPTDEREIYYFGRSRIPVKDIRKILLHAYGINFIIFNVLNDLEMFDEEHLKCGDVVYVEEDDNSHSYIMVPPKGPTGRPKLDEKLMGKEKIINQKGLFAKGIANVSKHLPSKKLEEKLAAFQSVSRSPEEVIRAKEENEREIEDLDDELQETKKEEENNGKQPRRKESPNKVEAKRRKSDDLLEWDLGKKLGGSESLTTLGSKNQSESTATLASKADFDPILTLPNRNPKPQDLKSCTFSDFSFMPLSLSGQTKGDNERSSGSLRKNESSNLVPLFDVREEEEEKGPLGDGLI